MVTTSWPSLPLNEWKETYETLHMLTQIIGKIQLALTPLENHWWNCTLYVTPTGLSTHTMYYNNLLLKIELDFVSHFLVFCTSKCKSKLIPLKSRPVADFYQETMGSLRDLGVSLDIWSTPVEVQERIPFEKDYKHSTYDPEYVYRLWVILAQSSRVFNEFRSKFIGKVSPVHFFWGAFDLAVTRFSGRQAPVHPGVPNCARFVMAEAYSHEVSSCGFWPGGGSIDGPIYYSYTYPEPNEFKNFSIQPSEAFYDVNMKEFVLPYEVVRNSNQPDKTLMDFLQSTYIAAASTGKWDRNTLERK